MPATVKRTHLPTERDCNILVTAYLYDGLTTQQIMRKFWPTAKSTYSYYPRLQLLSSRGYIKYQKIPVHHNKGTWYYFWTVTAEAKETLHTLLKVPCDQIRIGEKEKSPCTIPHTVKIGDVRLSLELAIEQIHLADYYTWYSEHELEADSIQVEVPLSITRLTITPDGMFIIDAPGWKLTAYIEVDLGTITYLPGLRQRFIAYLLHSRKLRTPSPILWIVSTPARAQRLSSLAMEVAATLKADPTIFLFTTFEKVTEKTILAAPIWSVTGGPAAYTILPQEQAQLIAQQQHHDYLWKS